MRDLFGMINVLIAASLNVSSMTIVVVPIIQQSPTNLISNTPESTIVAYVGEPPWQCLAVNVLRS